MKNTNNVTSSTFATILVVNPQAPSTRLRRACTGLGVFALAVAFSGCASHPKPLALDANTNPNTAITQLEQDLAAAEQEQQISVFAEKDYKGAQKYLKEAQNDVKDKDDRDEVLKDIGVARAYLGMAKTHSASTSPGLSDVMASRKLALDAGAAKFNKDELKDIDGDLAERTEKGAEGVNKIKLEDKTELQKRYLDLELAAIKSTYLGDAKAHIEGSKKLGAKKISPTTLKMAEEKYKSAEVAIETDRHNSTVVQNASKSALDAATKLAVVTETAVNAKGRTPEQIALEIEQQRSSNAALAGTVQAYSSALATSTTQNKNLDSENQDLANKTKALSGEISSAKAQEAAIAKAEKSFGKDEAEVYRQGDKLLIRLKALNFKSGSASLPNESIDLLGKVREVVAEFNPSKVQIEGHTDSVGSAAVNMKLSKERAEAVAKYMISTKVVNEDAISSEGFGPEKPLKPNGTRAGRATNRRVDLILTPMQQQQTPASDNNAG
ncbi:MAG: OmpA family protein [Bdellovibrionota bacterium]